MTMLTFYYIFSVVFHTHHTSLTSGLLAGSGNTHGHLVRYIEDYFDTSTTDLSEPSLYLSVIISLMISGQNFSKFEYFHPPQISNNLYI